MYREPEYLLVNRKPSEEWEREFLSRNKVQDNSILKYLGHTLGGGLLAAIPGLILGRPLVALGSAWMGALLAKHMGEEDGH